MLQKEREREREKEPNRDGLQPTCDGLQPKREREREREGENTYNPSTISSCFRPKDLCLSGPDIRWIPSTSDSAGRLLIPTLHIAWCHQLHQEVCEHMSMNACNNYIGTRHRHMAPGVACQYFANESHLDLAQRFSEQLNSLGFMMYCRCCFFLA